MNLTAGGSRTFSHDQNGNMTQGDGESITYNAFNKPLTITGGNNSTDFTYGADLMRYRQITPSGSTILYLDKLMEIESSGSAVDYRHYLSDVAILTKTGSLNDPSPGIKYTFRDRLGGVSMIADSSGIATEYRGYDAFGKPRNGNWTNKSPATINSSVTDRGFTDHEHLDDWQLIHMNGRGYDYNLGRFLSVDPFIQDPGNSQSINPYTYIMNNPLSGTDPTGYTVVCSADGTTCSETTVTKTARPGSLTTEKTTTTKTVTENEDGSTTGTVTSNGKTENYTYQNGNWVTSGAGGAGSDTTGIGSAGKKSNNSLFDGNRWTGTGANGRPVVVPCWMCPAYYSDTGEIVKVLGELPINLQEEMAKAMIDAQAARRDGDTAAYARNTALWVGLGIGILVESRRGRSGGVANSADPKALIPRQGASEMSGSQVKRLRKDMRQNGFDSSQPIDVADIDGRQVILDGHHRAAAARQAGIREVPIRTHTATSEQADQLLREAAEAAAGGR